MNSLDSRVIGFGDCYSKKMSDVGNVKYQLIAAAGIDMPIEEDTFKIKVRKRSASDKMAQGVVVQISGNKVTPAKVELLTGQTVFWAVEKAPGISITDRRLVGNTG